jgi:hypothetical protein
MHDELAGYRVVELDDAAREPEGALTPASRRTIISLRQDALRARRPPAVTSIQH